jgi:hypothetical protein
VINRKNVLGKDPEQLGIKDAIHTAIVSVRAGVAMQPGTRCKLNENREAVPDEKGIGVADPFRKGIIACGRPFWLLMGQTEVPNVQHHWDNGIDFSPPTVEPKRNPTLVSYAKEFGVTYEQILEAGQYVIDHDSPAPYPKNGTKTAEEVEAANERIDKYDLWTEWADEAFHEFDNHGTSCCPEYDYPDDGLFAVNE